MNPWMEVTWFTTLQDDPIERHIEYVKASAVGDLIEELASTGVFLYAEIRQVSEDFGEAETGAVV